MDQDKINISEEFTDTPGPRYIKQGRNSGEEFRKDLLIPRYKKARERKRKLIIELDGVYGYPPSFLEESFGGLIRDMKEPVEEVLKNIEFKCSARPYLTEIIIKYMKEANKK